MLLIKKTKVGMAMRAVSKDFETSQLMGIKINNVISATFVIGSALAAVGSILYFTDRMSVTPFSGTLPGLKCFVAAVFGGIGSHPRRGRGRLCDRHRRDAARRDGLFDLQRRVYLPSADRHVAVQADRPLRRKKYG